MSSQQKSLLIRYQYDALDRIASHSRVDGVERHRFYCHNRLVTETEGVEHISIFQQGDQLFAQQQRNGSEFDSALIATDQQRSVLNTLHPKWLRTIAYSPYGHRIAESELSGVLGFNGQRPERGTGHYLLGNGYRAFNPVLMRFNSPDNLSPFGKAGLNPYAYCFGNPINRSDPTGHVATALLKSAAREMSAMIGYNVKPIENLKSLTAGIGAFEDSYKGGARITVMGHGSGSPGEYLLAAGSDMFVDAKGLVDLAKQNNIDFGRYDSVRLLICHSAESGVNGKTSFARQFADIVELPVKAFVGEVGGKATRVPFVGPGSDSAHMDYFGVFKEPAIIKQYQGRDPYNPVKFQSGKIRNESSDIRG